MGVKVRSNMESERKKEPGLSRIQIPGFRDSVSRCECYIISSRLKDQTHGCSPRPELIQSFLILEALNLFVSLLKMFLHRFNTDYIT